MVLFYPRMKIGIVGALLGALSLAVAAVAAEWRRAEWRGEAAWESCDRGWTAVVSVDRARLIALTPPGGGDNLLFADLKNEFTWGGHRLWLGPQSAWSVAWPPPADWELSPAARVSAAGDELRVEHPRTDAGYPTLVRTYAWHDGTLHCGATWSDPRFFGIHILQLPSTAEVRVRAVATAEAPLGYVLLPIFRRNSLLTDRPFNPAAARRDGAGIVLRHANVTEKIGVVPQPITARIGKWTLTLERGRMEGFPDNEPDLGCMTQVFVGNDQGTFAEIEQITPYGGPGRVHSEILVRPGESVP